MSVESSEKALAPFVANTAAGPIIRGIHGLRGLAALAVVLFHFMHLSGIQAPGFLGFIAADFDKGVYLFFVLSAFSLMYSTERSIGRIGWVITFFTKRFWRIAPLFYLILGTMVSWQLFRGEQVGSSKVILNLLFATAFSPQDGMVPAGWTVAVEMLFYGIFPVLLLTVRSMRAAIALALVTTVVTYAGRTLLFHAYGESANFMFPSNLCFFAYGVLAFRIVQSEAPLSFVTKRVAPLLSLTAVALLLALPEDHFLREGAGLGKILWGLAFALLCIWRGAPSDGGSVGRSPAYLLGERSYSIYLMHPLVLWLLRPMLKKLYEAMSPAWGDIVAWGICAAILMVVLILISEATYRFVELPGIHIGRWVNQRRLTQSILGTP